MMNTRIRWRRGAVALLFVALSGCGNSLYEASGRLTYKGQPVPSTYVFFKPEEEGKRFSAGMTGPDGNFKLQFSTSESGVYPGKHTVYLRYYVDVEEELGQVKPRVPADVKKVISTKYGNAEKSPRKYEISKSRQFVDIAIE